MQLLYVSRRAADRWLLGAVRQMGHVAEAAEWGPETAALAAADDYDLILADMARPVPAEAADLLIGSTPVVVVADVARPDERAAILRAGADDCLTRPLHLIEVQTRLMALVRAADRHRPSPAARAGLRLDRGARSLLLGDRRAALSPLEFQLAAYLLRREGRVVEAARLDAHLAGAAAEPRPERIRGLVARLRAKLSRDLNISLIHSVPGHGYVLRLDAGPATDITD
jgi:two-component system OmpR family response regulator